MWCCDASLSYNSRGCVITQLDTSEKGEKRFTFENSSGEKHVTKKRS